MDQLKEFDMLHLIADEFNRNGFKTVVEGGGAAIPYLDVRLNDGRIVLFGNVSNEWSGQIYRDADALDNADSEPYGVDTHVRSSCYEPTIIVDCFKRYCPGI